MYCVDRKPLEFARSVCAVLGVRASHVRHRMRKGIQGIVRPLHSLDVSAHDVPESFFHLLTHKARAVAKKQGERRSREPWVVDSVGPTDREEEVFCATVDGVGAFGLADNLMTGNCPHQTDEEWAEVRDDPEEWALAVALEKEIVANDPEQKPLYLWSGRRPLELADFGANAGAATPPRPCEGGNCWT